MLVTKFDLYIVVSFLHSLVNRLLYLYQLIPQYEFIEIFIGEKLTLAVVCTYCIESIILLFKHMSQFAIYICNLFNLTTGTGISIGLVTGLVFSHCDRHQYWLGHGASI